jgi:hypothetical protein
VLEHVAGKGGNALKQCRSGRAGDFEFDLVTREPGEPAGERAGRLPACLERRDIDPQRERIIWIGRECAGGQLEPGLRRAGHPAAKNHTACFRGAGDEPADHRGDDLGVFDLVVALAHQRDDHMRPVTPRHFARLGPRHRRARPHVLVGRQRCVDRHHDHDPRAAENEGRSGLVRTRRTRRKRQIGMALPHRLNERRPHAAEKFCVVLVNAFWQSSPESPPAFVSILARAAILRNSTDVPWSAKTARERQPCRPTFPR